MSGIALTNGEAEATVALKGADPRAALWTRPGAKFVCLECWTGAAARRFFPGDR